LFFALDFLKRENQIFNRADDARLASYEIDFTKSRKDKLTNQIVTPTHPVHLLRDRKGVYGIGVVQGFKQPDRLSAPEIVLRPDLLIGDDRRSPKAALQMIPGGRGRGMFKYCAEEELRKVVHHGMLWREGLVPDDSECPRRPDGTWGNFWAIDPSKKR
jgi:hypothetical protein